MFLCKMMQDFILQTPRLYTWIDMYLNSLSQIHGPQVVFWLESYGLLGMVTTREHGLCD